MRADMEGPKIPAPDELKTDPQLLGDYIALLKKYTDMAIRSAASVAFYAAIDS